MSKIPEIKYYDSEENDVSWAPVQFAEIEVEKDGKKIYLSASPAGVDEFWSFSVSETSIVDMLEDDPEADFTDDIIESYGTLEEILNSEYLYEFIRLACGAANEFGQNTISIT